LIEDLPGRGQLYVYRSNILKNLPSLLERNAVPSGASTRNAGFVCFGSLTEVIADSQKMGREKTQELVKMRFNGLQRIQYCFKSDDLDFEHRVGYEIINNEEIP